jgi:hypothetical protein
MKTFLIGSCLVGLMMVNSPAVAETDRWEDSRAGFQKVDHDRGSPHHKKFLSSRHRDRDAHHDYRDRKHGWKNKAHNRHKHGWKHKKYHQKRHGYHGHQHHWNNDRHYYRDDRGTGFRFYYNNSTSPMEYQLLQGAQLLIDVTR